MRTRDHSVDFAALSAAGYSKHAQSSHPKALPRDQDPPVETQLMEPKKPEERTSRRPGRTSGNRQVTHAQFREGTRSRCRIAESFYRFSLKRGSFFGLGFSCERSHAGPTLARCSLISFSKCLILRTMTSKVISEFEDWWSVTFQSYWKGRLFIRAVGWECGVSRLARVMMDSGVRTDVQCVFNGWRLGFVLHGPRAPADPDRLLDTFSHLLRGKLRPAVSWLR